MADTERALMQAALPGYALGEELGRGGFAAVVRATHLALGRDVAVKHLFVSLASDDQALQRFTAEARTIAQIDHPHIVKVFDFVEQDGNWFIVMEYLSGGTLEDRLGSGLSLGAACGTTLGLCAALDVAHRREVLHRDVKPANVLFTSDGVARLADFGVAKVQNVDVNLTSAGQSVGTPRYMAPEVVLGEPATPASDLYSAGIVLYQMLAGRLPYDDAASPTLRLMQHVHTAPHPLRSVADVPPAIAEVVEQTLEKDPAQRPASAEALGVALADAAAATFGPGWLDRTGVRVMGGGPIVEAVYRQTSPTGAGPRVDPTTRAAILATAAPAAGATTEADGATRMEQHVPTVESAPPVEDATRMEVAVGALAADPATAAEPVVEVAPVEAGTRSRGPLVAGIVAAVLVAGGIAFVATQGGGDGTEATTTTTTASTTTTLPGPADVTVDESVQIPVGSRPWTAAAGGGLVWVPNMSGQTLTVLDEATGDEVRDPIPLAGGAETPLEHDGRMWAPHTPAPILSVIDQETFEITEVEVGANPILPRFGAGHVWVVSRGDGSLTRIDPDTLATERFAFGASAISAAVSGEEVWVVVTASADSESVGKVLRYDATAEEFAEVGLVAGGNEIFFADGTAWVTTAAGPITRLDESGEPVEVATPEGTGTGIEAFDAVWVRTASGAVLRIDPATNEVAASIEVGGAPLTPVASDDLLLVVSRETNELSVIDPVTDEIVDTQQLGRTPDEPLVTGDVWWVVLHDDDAVQRLAVTVTRA